MSTPHPPDRVRRVPRRRTDCDVYFRKPVRLADWGSPLPSAVGLAYEAVEAFPYNAGGRQQPNGATRNPRAETWPLAQVLRSSTCPSCAPHTSSLSPGSWSRTMGCILRVRRSCCAGEWHGRRLAGLVRASAGYGALDQGALNQFYEPHVRGRPISQDFNAKPFQARKLAGVCVQTGGHGLQTCPCRAIVQDFRTTARIVHFQVRRLTAGGCPGAAGARQPTAHAQGPKPNHYLDFVLKGECAFADFCEAVRCARTRPALPSRPPATPASSPGLCARCVRLLCRVQAGEMRVAVPGVCTPPPRCARCHTCRPPPACLQWVPTWDVAATLGQLCSQGTAMIQARLAWAQVQQQNAGRL